MTNLWVPSKHNVKRQMYSGELLENSVNELALVKPIEIRTFFEFLVFLKLFVNYCVSYIRVVCSRFPNRTPYK